MKEIPIGRKGEYVALVDDGDYAELSRWYWGSIANNSGLRYAVRYQPLGSNKYQMIFMHRQILGVEPKDRCHVDHANHNTLDNRRENIRIATPTQNQYNKGLTRQNTSGYKGVSLYKATNRWVASIRIDGRSVHLGYHATPEAAYAVYCETAKRVHGEFARLA